MPIYAKNDRHCPLKCQNGWILDSSSFGRREDRVFILITKQYYSPGKFMKEIVVGP
jgi:hypothetical protein